MQSEKQGASTMYPLCFCYFLLNTSQNVQMDRIDDYLCISAKKFRTPHHYNFPTFLRFSATLVPKLLPVDARRLDFACKSRFVATGFDVGRRTTSTQSIYESSDSSRVHSCGSQTHPRYLDYTRHLSSILYSSCKPSSKLGSLLDSAHKGVSGITPSSGSTNICAYSAA
jgi:hypothetical protein